MHEPTPDGNDRYISGSLKISDRYRVFSEFRIPLTKTIICDSELCALNPKGVCLAPILTGHPPKLTDDGCEDCLIRDDS